MTSESVEDFSTDDVFSQDSFGLVVFVFKFWFAEEGEPELFFILYIFDQIFCFPVLSILLSAHEGQNLREL
ncbi:hypothetical protein AKJ37_01010 [candidate division MSBL1 archaeon SCGC-AAA259I09]|uniref:Uncharacterized protein n=2 Tax=candidate division MSBL1 TaxID=215777 RepID=A0A133UTU7_9EURY|nr:hypothetical protein AKJ38_00835 [candidate division MSBL1 archaeon SCGC-AAA259I14]KXA98199.1 hypothetical protein AKJ37_01010 [candidate division MSBL1 archaeon SCGC-AAA259I09]